MGRFDFEIPQDFINQLGKLADMDRVAPQMLNTAAPILVRNLKAALAKHRQTGDLEKSVRRTGAKKNRYGHFVTVRPTGTSSNYISSDGTKKKMEVHVANMQKFMHLELGTSNQPARPVLAKVLKDSEAECLRIMQEVFDREMTK